MANIAVTKAKPFLLALFNVPFSSPLDDMVPRYCISESVDATDKILYSIGITWFLGITLVE